MRKTILSFALLLASVGWAQPDTISSPNHNAASAGATHPAAEQVEGAYPEPDAAPVDEWAGAPASEPVANPVAVEPAPEPVQERGSSGLGWLVLATGLATLLAVGSGVMTWLTRRQIADMQESYRHALEQTSATMRKLIDDSDHEVSTLRAQVTRLAALLQANAAVAATRENVAAQAKAPERPARREPMTLYLSKADEAGIFARVSQKFELGNSLFVLTTADGAHGTFVIVDNADAHRFALMMPTENLTRACTGEGIQLSAGKTAIVTDQPGEAVNENGAWRVTRKAVVHYT